MSCSVRGHPQRFYGKRVPKCRGKKEREHEVEAGAKSAEEGVRQREEFPPAPSNAPSSSPHCREGGSGSVVVCASSGRQLRREAEVISIGRRERRRKWKSGIGTRALPATITDALPVRSQRNYFPPGASNSPPPALGISKICQSLSASKLARKWKFAHVGKLDVNTRRWLACLQLFTAAAKRREINRSEIERRHV